MYCSSFPVWFGNLIEKRLSVGFHCQQQDLAQIIVNQCITNNGGVNIFSWGSTCNSIDLSPNITINLFIFMFLFLTKTKLKGRSVVLKKTIINLVSRFRSNETANAYWIPLQIIFGRHNFQKPLIELHPEWVTKSQGCSSYVIWCVERGGLWKFIFLSSLCVLHKSLRIKKHYSLVTSSPLHLFPKHLLFIMAYSPFGPHSYGWQGDKNAGNMNRWQVAMRVGERDRAACWGEEW